MTQAVKASIFGLLLAFATVATAVAEYIAPSFVVLAGRSDLIVAGMIAKVSPKTFTLRVEEVLAGSERSKEIEVLRFEDWTCSFRWKPYEAGQREIAFLHKLSKKEARESGAKYGTMSAGDEGEWEIVGKEVSVQGFRVPGGREFDQGEHPGQWLPLDLVLDSIRRFRRCFSIVTDKDPWGSKILQSCSATELAEYRSRSYVHAYLVETALESGR